MKLYTLLAVPTIMIGSIYQNGNSIKLYADQGNCPTNAAMVTMVAKDGTTINRGCWTLHTGTDAIIILWDGAKELQIVEPSEVKEISYA